ncbi:MAG: hypothetical protein OIF50_01555 [Flavobacteriaceae bacterium]|nr:hypothetical protein [Flavobacteriaceae bacterium]
MRYWSFILMVVLLAMPKWGISQMLYTIKGFSQKYYAEVTIADGSEAEVFKEAVIRVFDSQNSLEVIELEVAELHLQLDTKGKPTSNFSELPYGDQSVIVAKDFNFDGQDDLAIMDGQNSCYHGPSFQIYLQSEAGLKHSEAFSRLAQEYCGLFDVNTTDKSLHTMTKSGCCWHQFSTFEVVDNIPKLKVVVEEDASQEPFHITTVKRWENGKMSESIEKTIDLESEDVELLFSFRLFKNYKKVYLLTLDKENLLCVLVKPDDTVDFFYPADNAQGGMDFKYDAKSNKLVFTEKGITYHFYQQIEDGILVRLGIEIYTNGEQHWLKGDPATVIGSLKNIHPYGFKNVE